MWTKTRFNRTAALALLLCAMGLAACGGEREAAAAEAWAPEQLTRVAGVPIADIQQALGERLAESAPEGVEAEQWDHAKALYESYGTTPLWLTSRGLHERRSRELAEAIINAHSDALRLDDYPIARLADALAALKRTRRPTAEQLVEADVLLTATYAALGEDLLTGHIDPRTMSQSWHVDPREENVDSALARGLRVGSLERAFGAMRPADPDYDALRRELVRYREIVARGGWQPVPGTKAVRPGEAISPAVASALRARLEAEGIAVAAPDTAASNARTAQGTLSPATPASAVYDHALAGAVAEFQARHTIVEDSMLGPETLAAMNRPAAYRLAQIAANLERYRWLPREFGARYIFVNVPAFRLEAYDQGQRVLEMRVIVGAEYQDRATPVFADSMSFVVFRPYWFVPDNIAERDIYPRGPQYLAANNFETYTYQGRTRIRQRPGEKNSLGLAKFMFPNDFAIYLHDTPNEELFDRDIRAFSSGCIRVEHPDQLGAYVLGWPADSVRRVMENGPNDNTVNLSQKLPVYIVYLTTFMRNDQLHFGNDLYSRDDRLVEAFIAGAMPSPQTVQAVEALRRIAAR
jgi:L,D-transpeptidase YcbB